jgi:hypothetical protein
MSNYRKYIILTVEPLRNVNKTFRLGLMKEDFNQIRISTLNIKSVEVILDSIENKRVVNIIEALRTYSQFGKLVNPLIDDWIKSNDLHLTQSRKPTKLIFELKITEKKHIYKLYKNK